jgi:hypothetical protein
MLKQRIAALLLMGLTVFIDQKKNNRYTHIIYRRQFFSLPRVDHCGDQTDNKGDKNSAFKGIF